MNELINEEINSPAIPIVTTTQKDGRSQIQKRKDHCRSPRFTEDLNQNVKISSVFSNYLADGVENEMVPGTPPNKKVEYWFF